ncbi:RNA-binding domain-containing protein [Aulographum hederae CBS 113979]|uniref:RNA-binding domain-containing protein n=1 Tax=Aulographum hederae CBS 113979 TaxID=1176131 RepID=A0A6G1H775_9PEZI|nr:RNA-binding domain-containing protein [Aulographum hederae CBS 113979]
MSEAQRLKSTLFVSPLAPQVTENVLHSAFIPFGEISSVSLPKPDTSSHPDPHRGYGYVEFELATDAKEAIDNMDQSELYGRVIKVALARERKEENSGLGSKTAIWEQEGYLAKHAVSEEDRMAAGESHAQDDGPMDPMQGLEGLDVAGPKPE